MGIILFFFLALSLAISINPVSSLNSNTLSQGSSISVEKPEDKLQCGVFSAGFYQVGDNAYTFAIWYSSPACRDDCTVVWMAKRDFPVNGRRSKLFLTNTGNLILTDASKTVTWSTNTNSMSITELVLKESGNLVLKNAGEDGAVLWQSFDCPTHTLLPNQKLTRETQLVSSRSSTNISSGFYKLLFDDENLLVLVYDGRDVSSNYWPDPLKHFWQIGRFAYNSSRTASLDFLGNFSSSDKFFMLSSDHGQALQRRLTLDYDGNLRLYSRDERRSQNWIISVQAIETLCEVHGICGPNSTCSYSLELGRKCYCLPRYRMKNTSDWSYGCEPEFSLPCPHDDEVDFYPIRNLDFYGYDFYYKPNTSLSECKKLCLELCDCKGFQFKLFNEEKGALLCYPKSSLLNGFHSPSFNGTFYLKINKGTTRLPSGMWNAPSSGLQCPAGLTNVSIDRAYSKRHGSKTLKLLLLVACTLMGIEITGMLFVWLFLVIRSRRNFSDRGQKGYLQQSRFQSFTYSELAKATKNFQEEIGRGAGGIVYKGTLSDGRVAAIKKLYGANQVEADFLAEISTIGKLNHMNLIEMWGYCTEGKHRLLVYEYMEHGSLAQNLTSKSLDWEKRFNIAFGTAKGLAYLHEECLEWVLHCDVKPQNILLDADFQPKVSDFGLSKLLNRNDSDNSRFSKIRGTRGYMAPEWVFNLPITSKVDVYSYGVVVLELVTGKHPVTASTTGGTEEESEERVVTWVRNRKNGFVDGGGNDRGGENADQPSWVEEMMDPAVEGDYDKAKMELLVTLAVQCVEEDRNARPTMGKVVEMLLEHENDSTSD